MRTMDTTSLPVSTPLTPDFIHGAVDIEQTPMGLLPHRLPAWARAQCPDAQLAMAEWTSEGGRDAEIPWLVLIAAESENGQTMEAHADLQKFLATPRTYRIHPATAAGSSGGSCADGAPVPWQELVETGGWMIADPGKHVGEPSAGIDAIELGGDHK